MDTLIAAQNVIVDTNRIQYGAIIGSLLLFLFIFELTRKGAIRIPYSLLWFFLSILFLTISLWRNLLEQFAGLIGVAYAPAALFLILIIGIIGMLIHVSIVLSSLSERTRVLVQEIAIIKQSMHNSPAPSTIPSQQKDYSEKNE
jgi:hypothetical protein